MLINELIGSIKPLGVKTWMRGLQDGFALVMLLNAARQCSIPCAEGIGWLIPRCHAPFNARPRRRHNSNEICPVTKPNGPHHLADIVSNFFSLLSVLLLERNNRRLGTSKNLFFGRVTAK